MAFPSLATLVTILSNRLQLLVHHRLLEKVRTRPEVDRFHYKLTKSGKDLFPVIVALMQWGDKWVFGPGQEPLRITDKKYGAPIQALGVLARDGRYLERRDVAFLPGPGASQETLALFEIALKGLQNSDSEMGD